MIKLFGSRQI